jgi:hypothetical protein
MDEQVTMPGTIIDPAAKRIRWVRTQDLPGCRSYQADVPDGLLRCIVSHDEVAPGQKLWHVSVSHVNRHGECDRLPTWDEIKHAKYQLLPRDVDVAMVLIFPRKKTPEPYVNIHETTLHLYESTEKGVDK